MSRDLGWSSIAVRADEPRDVRDRAVVWGVALHTTGSGLVSLWKKRVATGHFEGNLLEFAVAWYTDPDNYAAHYVVGHDGTAVQIANDFERMPHIGMEPRRRAQYLSGDWLTIVPPKVAEAWCKAWPGKRSPAHLYPSYAPNEDYVGIEMIPTTGTDAVPMYVGARFTQAQHEAAADLAWDIATRHRFPAEWWKAPSSSRLVGHEDVGLLDRFDRGGGWDPGALRAGRTAHFSMSHVRGALALRESAQSGAMALGKVA